MNIFIGATGAGLILLAFVLNELHVWGEDDLAYDVVNLLGAVLLVWYAWLLASWPFGILNGVWLLVSLRDVILDLRRDKAPQPGADRK